jgi:hypothetical protein
MWRGDNSRLHMAASIARKVTALLFAMAMIGSVAVGPALADDDDVSVGGDGVDTGDGVTVGVGENGSVAVEGEAGTDGVDGGVEADDGNGNEVDSDDLGGEDTGGSDAPGLPGAGEPEAPSQDDAPDLPSQDNAPEAPSTGDSPEPEAPTIGGGSGSGDWSTTMDEISTPDESVEFPNLPVNYEEDVPFEALPNFCNPPYGVDDVKDNNPVNPTDPVPDAVKEQAPEQAPTEPPKTPVGNPIGLVSSPISQCTVFNPADPPVNPTSPPDDPAASASTSDPDNLGPAGGEGALATDATTGESGPGAETFNGIVVSQESTLLFQQISATDGKTRSGGTVMAAGPNDPRQTDVKGTVTAYGKSASVSLDCGGGQCKPKAGGVPSGNAAPAIPTGGSSDDGGESEDPEPGPSADDGQPNVNAGQDEVAISDDRSATLGQGLPGGSNDAFIGTNGDVVFIQQQGAAEGRTSNLNVMYARGEFPGDDDVYVLAKGEGGGVIVGLNCDDYRCTPSGNTGVYAGPAGMITEMVPSEPPAP